MRHYKIYDIELDFDQDINISRQSEITNEIISQIWNSESYNFLRSDILARYGYDINFILWDELDTNGNVIPVTQTEELKYTVDDDGNVIEM